MRLKQQLLSGFGGMLILVLIIGGLALWSLMTIRTSMRALSDSGSQVQLVGAIKINANLIEGHTIKSLFLSDPNIVKTLLEARDAARKVNEDNYKQLSVIVTNEKAKALLTVALDKSKAYGAAIDAIDESAKSAVRLTLMDLIDKDIGPSAKAYNEALDTLLKFQNTTLDESRARADTTINSVLLVVISVLAFAIAAAAIASVVITRSVLGVLGGDPGDAARSVALIASGDLTQPIVTQRAKSLLGNLEAMRVELKDVIHQLTDGAGQLANFSGKLAKASQELAAGACSGSDAASNMAASVEEMTVSIAHVSDSASDAARSAARTGDIAANGSQKVLDLAGGMSDISVSVNDSASKVADLGKQSDEIRSIVGVIKEIAEQTNLLALNAAIEAARAGEQGRGFAVVADEVRKLAERTTQSTQDIARKIEAIQSNVRSVVATMNHSVEQVVQGERLAGQGAEAIGNIQTATKDVVNIVKNISEAIRENSTASQQVAKTVEHIAQLSEENSGGASQVAATADQLTQLATQLNQIASRFKA